jgi:hypothetical protein
MADPEAQRTKTVSQAAINDLKTRGMAENLKMYNSGAGTSEFKTAMERYYSPQRLKAGSGSTTAAAPKSAVGGPKMSNAVASKPVPMPASAPAAAVRKIAPTGPKKIDTAVMGGLPKAIGNWLSSGNKAAAAQEKVRAAARPAPTPPKPKTPQEIATKAANEKTYQNSRVDIQKMK